MIPIASVSEEPDLSYVKIDEPASAWKQYMDNLHKYAQCQTQLYQSHAMSDDKPWESMSEKDIDQQDDDQWMNYAKNIT